MGRIPRYIYLLSCSITLLLPDLVRAEILFLNFNRNNSTLEQIESIAKESNDSVISYPNTAFDKIDKNNIGDILSDANLKKTKPIHTLVISGHAFDMSFSGSDGEIHHKDIHSALADESGLKNDVKHLFLRGCYTTRLFAILPSTGWRNTFPNLNYIAGYTGKAWSSETSYSQNFVRDGLHLADDFIDSGSIQSSIEVFKKIDEYEKSTIGIWVKTKQDEEYYLTTERLIRNKKPIDLSEKLKACQHNLKLLPKHADTIALYDQGLKEGFKRPPKDTARSNLRSAYAWMLKNQHCMELGAWKTSTQNQPSFIAGLLFYNNATKSFLKAYNVYELKTHISEINQFLGKDFKLPDLENDSRGQLRNFVLELSGLVKNHKYNELSQFPSTHKLDILTFYVDAISKLLIDLDPIYLPRRWLSDEGDTVFPLLMPTRESITQDSIIQMLNH